MPEHRDRRNAPLQATPPTKGVTGRPAADPANCGRSRSLVDFGLPPSLPGFFLRPRRVNI